MNQTLLSSFGTAFERVEHALDALREGRGVMVLDDEDRENLRQLLAACEKNRYLAEAWQAGTEILNT